MTRRGAALAAIVLLVAAPAAAASDLRDNLLALQALDARVQTAGWRLAHGNAAYCRNVAPGIGLQLLDVAGYSDPAAVRTALGLPSDIAVGAVAAGGPADRAGLRANLGLRAVGDQAVALLPVAKSGDYARLTGLHDAIDATLEANARIAFVDAAGGTIVADGSPACVTRFELLTSGSRATADGRRVTIGRKLVEAIPEDDLLAAALAHELAHNLLGHRATLDREGRGWKQVRRTEREADRMMPWLLANAGYDPAAAVRFFERWGPRFDLGIFATPDHDGWRERVRRVSAELPKVEKARAAGGGAVDWRAAFALPDKPDGAIDAPRETG